MRSHIYVCYHKEIVIKHHKAWQSICGAFIYLLKITTIAIIKANAIIVIPTKP